ncbi:MAG: DUF560 domain-containing protein [Nitrospinaceae bacterium]|nr:MAG: DUF560 domain-containing protein [Nitrospinaceae bacterium]
MASPRMWNLISGLTLCLFTAGLPMLAEGGEKPWHVDVTAGFEYNDNLTRPEKDIVSGDSDIAGVFELSGGYRFLDTPDFKLEGNYDFYQSLYADRSDFNFQSHTFNLGGSTERGNTDFGVDIAYTNSNLDGDDFMELFMFLPRMGIQFSPALYTDLIYMYQNKDFDTESRRDADQHSIGMTQFLFFMDSKAYLSGSYRLASEDARGAEFDYLANILRAALKVPGPFETLLNASYEFNYRNYDHTTPSIGKEREDKINTLKAGLSKKLTEPFDLGFNYQYTNNDSNLPSVDYSENIVTIALGAHF